MIHLGIDPDTTTTGMAMANSSQCYAVAVAKGKGDSLEEKLTSMYDEAFYAIQGMLDALGDDLTPTFSGLVVVEKPIVRTNSPARPNDQIKLAVFSGMLACAATAAIANYWINQPRGRSMYLRLPEPMVWKKGVPKRIHQSRIYSRLNWTYRTVGTVERGYAIPTQDGIPKPKYVGEWKHIGDAIGLAMWGDIAVTLA